MAIIAAGIGAAGAIGSSEAGKKAADSAADAQSQITEQQAKISRELLDQTRNARGLGTQQAAEYLATGELPLSLRQQQPNLYGLDQFMQTGQLPPALALAPTTAASRDTLEQQFGRARESTINQASGLGGYLGQGLVNLEGQRALGVTSLYDQENQQKNALGQKLFGVGLDFEQQRAQRENALRQQLYASSVGVGFGQVANAGNALAQAGQGQAAIASQGLAQRQVTNDKYGTLAGYALPAVANSNALGLSGAGGKGDSAGGGFTYGPTGGALD